jgi:hypothetical protein
MEDLIEVLSKHYTEQEIREMNPYQARDEYEYILSQEAIKDNCPYEQSERRNDENLASFNERFSGDYHD